jgi:hypothetical protein
MSDEPVFKVWVTRYWLTEGVFESHAITAWEGRGRKYVYLSNASGTRVAGYPFLRQGSDVTNSKEEAKQLVHKLAGRRVKSLQKQIQKVQERAKDPWKKQPVRH